MRFARWTLIGMVAGVVAGLMAGLLRRQPTRNGREAYAGGYAPPVPSIDRSVAPVRPKTSTSWSELGPRSATDRDLGSDASRDPIAVDGRAER